MSASEAPGWDAIGAALAKVYGDREPIHYGTAIKYALGGPDPLDGISIYANDAPVPHWHYVTYGFSELYEKETQNADLSGFGFELTFRLARRAGEGKPPTWPMNFLQNLARYVFSSGNAFAAGHHVNLNGPIALEEKTEIGAVVFARDPKLARAAGPHGAFDFLQVVGLTMDEYALIKTWDSEALTGVLAAVDPLLLTDLGRPSLLRDAARAAEIHARVEKEGSSMASTYVDRLAITRSGKGAALILGALIVPDLVEMLAGRILHGRDFVLDGPEAELHLKPAAKASWTADDEVATLEIPDALAREMRSSLKAERGDYSWSALPGLTLRVEPTEIKDRAGRVVRVVG